MSCGGEDDDNGFMFLMGTMSSMIISFLRNRTVRLSSALLLHFQSSDVSFSLVLLHTRAHVWRADGRTYASARARARARTHTHTHTHTHIYKLKEKNPSLCSHRLSRGTAGWTTIQLTATSRS